MNFNESWNGNLTFEYLGRFIANLSTFTRNYLHPSSTCLRLLSKMDELNFGWTEGPQTEFPNGHSIQCSFIGVVVPSGENKIVCQRLFDINCAETPTSWKVDAAFERQPSNDVSCLTFITRTDNATRSVNVQFWISIHFDNDCIDVSYVRHFILDVGYWEVCKQIETLSIPKYTGLELCAEHRVRVSLIVHGCHSVQGMVRLTPDAEEGMDTDNADFDYPASKRRRLFYRSVEDRDSIEGFYEGVSF